MEAYFQWGTVRALSRYTGIFLRCGNRAYDRLFMGRTLDAALKAFDEMNKRLAVNGHPGFSLADHVIRPACSA